MKTWPGQSKIQLYAKLERIDNTDQGRLYLTPEGYKVPSVTTILGKVSDNSFLDVWRSRVGVEHANMITEMACKLGNHLHDYIEHTLSNQEYPHQKSFMAQAGMKMANFILADLEKANLNNYVCEQPLYFDNLYAGTSDLIGYYDDELQIIDFKNATKGKKIEDIPHYVMQIAAYAMAHNWKYGTSIKRGKILMVPRDNPRLLKFDIVGDIFENACEAWVDILDVFYSA